MTPETSSQLDSPNTRPSGLSLACGLSILGGGPDEARHPHFHMGASLLPANLPLLERLGVAGKVRSIGDACTFIDPGFSSGVMLAMTSA
jgi:hypothetical protein